MYTGVQQPTGTMDDFCLGSLNINKTLETTYKTPPFQRYG